MSFFLRTPVILGILIVILSTVETKPQIPFILFTDIHHHVHTPEPYSLEWLYQVARNRNFTEIDSVKNNLDYLINLVSTALDNLEYQCENRDKRLKNTCKDALASYTKSAVPWGLLAGILYKLEDSSKEVLDAATFVGFITAVTTSGFFFFKGTFDLKDGYDDYKYLPQRVAYHQWLLSVLKNKKAESTTPLRHS